MAFSEHSHIAEEKRAESGVTYEPYANGTYLFEGLKM